jgi:predicted adenine nucleotide alpha hydrolase (AANH) superfamily ATPase
MNASYEGDAQMTVNFQREMDKMLAGLERSGVTPRLLLHSCCAPCSTYVIEYLSEFFEITVLYYNPNIYPESEFMKRAAEQRDFLEAFVTKRPVSIIAEEHRPSEFYDAVRGLEDLPEGGERCLKCYRLRLEETARRARELGCDYFATTLSISPHKDAEALNRIGEELAGQYGVKHLCADFKKKNGYKRSVELSNQYGLYRQDYCGCVYSMT